MDVPAFGSKFTWFNRDGSAMSRLDRFLLSKEFVELWNIVGQYVIYELTPITPIGGLSHLSLLTAGLTIWTYPFCRKCLEIFGCAVEEGFRA